MKTTFYAVVGALAESQVRSSDSLYSSLFSIFKIAPRCAFQHCKLFSLRFQNEARAYLFVQDFVIPQLLDKDLGDIWGEAVHDPMGVLASLLAKEGRGAPEPRYPAAKFVRVRSLHSYRAFILSSRVVESTQCPLSRDPTHGTRRVKRTAMRTCRLGLGALGESGPIRIRLQRTPQILFTHTVNFSRFFPHQLVW